MKVIQNRGPLKVVLVACQHGNEIFGQRVVRQLEQNLEQYPGLRLILANEEAYATGSRFIDQDLNRSFPGRATGNHEEQLAAKLRPVVIDAPYLLDIHTTTSEVQMTPIIGELSVGVRQILNLTTSREIVAMGEKGAKNALIGQVSAGVSLEFGDRYAQTETAMAEIMLIINGLLGGNQVTPRQRRIFQVAGTIPLELPLPPTAQNFQFIPELGFYPFLLHEVGYTTHRGFQAPSYKSAYI